MRAMVEGQSKSVNELLLAMRSGDDTAVEQLMPIVYGELRRVAGAAMAQVAPGNSLQPTALVNEAYMRLMGGADAGWENRRHFFFAAARAMHDILVEQARRKAALKRGGDRKRVNSEDLVVAIESPVEDMIALDEALQRLRTEDERKYNIVELRFFAGLSMEETAAAMDSSLRTIEREWAFIRARLHRDLSSADGAEPG
jgi:RNA polymerase sigma factor (TIGR02999 family)